MVEMNSKMFATPDEMSPDKQASLSKALDELQLWLGADDLVARRPDHAGKPPIPEPSRPFPLNHLKIFQLRRRYCRKCCITSIITFDPNQMLKPPSMQIGDIFAQVFNPEKPKTVVKPMKSIAAQVDEIIQEKLPGSPYKNRIISVTICREGITGSSR